MHLVWDWNGTLLDDVALVVAATNASLAALGGGPITVDEHRRGFRRPIVDFYSGVLGRPVDPSEFGRLDQIFHDEYRLGMTGCVLAPGALDAVAAWSGSQSLLSMYFHADLVPLVGRYGLADLLSRVDGLRDAIGGGSKTPHLRAHLDALGIDAADCVLVGDSLDDAEAAELVGAQVVLYTGGFTDEDRLRATGHPVATTLMEAVALADAAARAGVASARAMDS